MNTAMLRNMSNEELDRMLPFITVSPSLTEQDVLNEVQRRVEELNEDIKDADDTRAEGVAEELIDAHEQEIGDLKEELIDAHEQEIGDLKEELIDAHEQEIGDLKEEHKDKIEELNKWLEGFANELDAVKRTLYQTTDKLAAREKQVKALTELDAVKRTLDQTTDKLAARKKRVKALTEQLGETEDANSRLRSEHQALGEQLKRLERAYVNIGTSRDTARRDWQNSANKLEAVKRTLDQTTDKLAAREKQVKSLIEQNSVLASEGDLQLSERLLQITNERDKWKNHVVRLTSRLANVRAAVDEEDIT